MYGPLTSDLANAVQADRNRYAEHLALEMAALRSRPAKPRTRLDGRSLLASIASALAAIRTSLVRRHPSTTLT